ncbi:E3 ubiquitin-protein ligase TRIM21 [Nerophis ophidion]|uniref:E3 ubiquitin-protein ligase TRIM21 n=1 Tax=Nerophis ophidion TaxID=159077 RepID=UPI002ADFF96C|nr:E3 ubiquitin-protein ligase TRIM21 [Nerophis ophidion]
MEMKSILKSERRTLKAENYSTKQSSSVGALRWALPEEDIQVHGSAPSAPISSFNLTGQSQHHRRQSSLKDLRSLQECVEFINHWKEQVEQVCKRDGGHAEAGSSRGQAKKSESRAKRSLEESRKLILEWASELNHVDKFLKKNPVTPECKEPGKESEANEVQLRIMDWAKELQEVSENCGVPSDQLGKVLRLLGLKKKRLVSMLPLLEFITWSLLKEDSEMMIPRLWLPVKQRTWKAGTSSYIPNSVWNWICSAAADVILDPMTNHPWLNLSEDQRQVQEALSQADHPYSSQRFDSWACVLAWEGYSRGRHYWEVDISNNGYWRLGLTTANSKRHGRFPMIPKTGYWCLWRTAHQFYACTKPETPLPVGLVPRRMGVYLDYEEGQISFYNAETKSHIYTFTGNFKEKVYPLFAPLDGNTRMTVIPQQNNKASGS